MFVEFIKERDRFRWLVSVNKTVWESPFVSSGRERKRPRQQHIQ